MSAWEEIRKLQAMLSEVQQIDVSQRLSERNCVEVMTKLIELGLLEVVHTLDGREYVTHDQISREIREEVAMRGGRSEFGELQTALNIDVNHIQKKVDEITRREKRSCDMQVIMGQVVTASYLDGLADELVDELNTAGSLRYADLAKRFDLPAEFVRDTLGERLARRVRVRVDEATATVYTACFYETHSRKLRGALGAALHPVSLAPLCTALGLHERVALGALDEALRSGTVRGELIGGGTSLQNATFIPDVYARTQREFVANALRTRRFVDFASLARINLTDASGAYLRRTFGNEFQLQILEHSAVTLDAVELCEATCEDCVRTASGCVDLSSVLPSGLPQSDARALIETVVRRVSKSLADDNLTIVSLENWHAPTDSSVADTRLPSVLVGDATLIGGRLFGETWTRLVSHVDSKAITDADRDEYNRPAFFQRLRTRIEGVTPSASAPSSRKAAASVANEPDDSSKKTNFGKATKKKYNPHGKTGRNAAAQRAEEDDADDADLDDNRTQRSRANDTELVVEGVRRFELDEIVTRAFSDVSDDSAITCISAAFHREANSRYQQALYAALRNKQSAAASAQAEVEGDRRKRYQRAVEQLQSRWYTLRLVQRGCDLLAESFSANSPTASTAQTNSEQASKHVLRSIGAEIFQLLVAVALFDQPADQSGRESESSKQKWTFEQLLTLDAERVNTDTRVSWVEQVGEVHKELRAPLAKLAQTISKTTIADFVTQFEAVCSLPVLQLAIKKLDAKIEKSTLLEYKHVNLESLNGLLVPTASPAQLADALQLAVALLFNAQTKAILYVPSRLSRVVLEHVITPLFADANELEPLTRLGTSSLKTTGGEAPSGGQKPELDQETCERIAQLVKGAFQRNWKAGRSN